MFQALLLAAVLSSPSVADFRLHLDAAPPPIILSFEDDEKEPEIPKLTCPEHRPGLPCVLAYRFSSGIHTDAVKKFVAFVMGAQAAHVDEIMLELNTPGGEVDVGHEMARVIEISSIRFTCVADGQVESMGWYVLQSCERRLMTKRTVLMTHGVASSKERFESSGQTRWTATNLSVIANEMEVSSRAYEEWCAHRLKIPFAEFHSHIADGREWWLDWETALRVGAVDGVSDSIPNVIWMQMLLGKKF